MRSYLDLMDKILTHGRRRETPRNGSATLAIFGEQLRFNLADGFPLVTTRKVPIRGIIEELLWFLSGSTNNEDLVAKKVHIWDQWALGEDTDSPRLTKLKQGGWENQLDEDRGGLRFKKGELGPIYGKMWRAWPNPDGTTTDQIQELLTNLKNKPYSRRHVISAWNPSVLPDESISPQKNVLLGRQALAACHTTFQFSVEPLTIDERTLLFLKTISPITHDSTFNDVSEMHTYFDKHTIPRDRLSCMLFARSQDVPVGSVFNIASYACLTILIARQLGFHPGEYIHVFGDAHIYVDQIPLVREQLERQPKALPTLKIRTGVSSLFDYQYSDFTLENYDPHPAINYPITV